ncbi:TetR family transcriptional regulator, partial [bacterium]|nr:TetR family transcriptional regulator [bacterium]
FDHSHKVSLKKNRRTQILKAAAFVFKKKGYDRATLQDIVSIVGITKAALYHYFQNKHDLLYTIIHTMMIRGIDELTKIFEMPISSEEKICLAFKQHFSSYEFHFPEFLVLLHEKTNLLPPKIEKQIKQEFKQYISIWEQLIREGIVTGHFRQDLDPKLITWSAIGMCNWVYKWGSPKGRFKFDQIAEVFNHIFLEGIQN